MSQSQLATVANVTQATIANLETGKQRPRPTTLARLARGLRVPVDQLWQTVSVDESSTGRRHVVRELLGYDVTDLKHPCNQDRSMADTTYDHQLMAEAIGWLRQEAQSQPSEGFWIVADDDKAITANTVEPGLDTTGGAGFTNRLVRDRAAVLPTGETVRYTTLEREGRTWRLDGAILAIHPTSELLDELHTHYVGYLGVIPWLPSDVENWVDTWAPRQIVNGTARRTERRELVDPEVREAVDWTLSHLSGTGHPSDQEFVATRFGRLRREGHELDARAIRAHALRTSYWYPSMVDNLIDLATGKVQPK